MKTEINKTSPSQVELKITVSSARVGEARQKVIQEKAKGVKLPGFRQGHAPEELVKNKLSPEELNGEVINRLVSEAYATAIKEHHLKPVISPQIELLEFAPEEDKDLVFKATTAERPAVELGDYKKAARELKKKEILGPDGEKPINKEPQTQLNQIAAAIVGQAKAEIPPILIDQEVNRMLTRLIDQTGRLGMTVEQYLQSQGKSADDLRKEYAQQAHQTIKTELVLDEIANQEGVSVADAEIEQAIKANPDEKSRKELAKEENKWYIKTIIKRNKVLQLLQKLADQ